MHTPITQQNPAEGSRDVIDRELQRLDRKQPAKAGPDDILRLLGETSPDRIAAILGLGPSVSDLEQAALWGQGDGDQLGRSLTGKPAAIVEIVHPDWEELEEDR